MSKVLRELQELVDALESKDAFREPKLMPGQPLKIESLSPTMRMIALDPLFTHSRPVRMVDLKAEEPKSDLEVWYAISK